MKFRDLRADEVEARVSKISEKGCALLLYKDARCDMRVLDESGVKWQRRHYECKGNLFCSVGIYDEDLKEWVWKDDCGTESYSEKEKGEASDSYKRACFNWGIGRELYTAPFIWIKADDVNLVSEKGKYSTYDKFKVTAMVVKDGIITALNIENRKKNKTVYTFGNLSEIAADKCCECGKDVNAELARKSANKYGKVYCCGECKEKHDERQKH